MTSRPNPSQALYDAYGPNPYGDASDRIFQHFSALGKKIERTRDPHAQPDTRLPVDVFLDGLGKHQNSPQVVLRPQRLGSQLWTESVTMYVYAGIEGAFVRAHSIPGGNRIGLRSELLKLKAWGEGQLNGHSDPVPQCFVQLSVRLFARGLLEDRRDERIGVLMDIADHAPPRRSDLEMLLHWLKEDLQNKVFREKGRPHAYQPTVFVAQIASLWNRLTERPAPKGPKTKFAEFVTACWTSGFAGEHSVPNLKRILREHIVEDEPNEPCGRCQGCLASTGCTKKIYLGTLNYRS